MPVLLPPTAALLLQAPQVRHRHDFAEALGSHPSRNDTRRISGPARADRHRGIGRRERNQTSQREIAGQILEIFESPQPLPDLLCSTDSAARRRLYLLAMRVQDIHARESALELVAVSGSDGSAERLHDAWFNAMTHVGRVWRQGKAKA
ncbi:hypothetical protein GCM10027614_35590 [Micromonospora vulcania]